MTTFTSDDREEAYKKILEEAPIAEQANASPPHIVDSGASVMTMNAYELADEVEMWGNDLLALNMKGGIPVVEGAKLIRHQADYIKHLEDGLESSINLNKAQTGEINSLKKELYFKDYYEELPDTPVDLLRKAQEK